MSNTGFCIVGLTAALCIIWADVALAEETLHPDSELSRSASLAEKGLESYQNGNYTRAEQLLREALAIREHWLTASDPQIAATLNDLGASLHYQSRFQEAEMLYQRALGIYGDSTNYAADRARVMANLGSAYREQRQFTKALDVYSQLFQMMHDSESVSESTKGTIYNDYGMLLRAKGDWTGAERAFERAAGIQEKRQDPTLISVWASLADLYYGMHEYDRAENLLRQTVETCDRMLGREDRHCASPLNGLALAQERRGLVDEPDQLLHRALAIFEKTYGPNHPKVAAVLNNLGSLAEHKRDYKHAEQYLSRALAIWTTTYGEVHPDVASASSNLASVYMHRHQWAQAESFYQRSYAINEKLYGSTHERLALDLNNLGVLYSAMKRYNDADTNMTRSIETYERAAGSDSTAMAGVLINLANQRATLKRYADAIPLYKRALDIYEHHPGGETAVAAAAFENYARLLRKTDDFAEAQKAEAFAMRIRVRNSLARDRMQSSFVAQH